MINKSIEKAANDKKKLAIEYNVTTSSIIWIGDNHYIIIKEGNEIRI